VVSSLPEEAHQKNLQMLEQSQPQARLLSTNKLEPSILVSINYLMQTGDISRWKKQCRVTRSFYPCLGDFMHKQFSVLLHV